jgi:hypothetical protein
MIREKPLPLVGVIFYNSSPIFNIVGVALFPTILSLAWR